MRILFLIILLFYLIIGLPSASAQDEVSEDVGPQENVPISNTGNFGNIDYRPIFLEPPGEQVERLLAGVEPSMQTKWKFRKSLPEIRALFTSCQLRPDTISALTSPSRITVLDQQTVVHPSAEDIFSLSPENRRDLYPHLNWTTHILWRKGFREMAGSNSGISETMLNDLTSLSYRDERGRLRFMDVYLALSRAGSREERLNILKVLLRMQSYQATLSWANQSDSQIEEMIRYWDSGGKNSAGAHLLQSVINAGSLQQVSLSRILPPRCRELLNTYPEELVSRGLEWPDCFTTAFSFFDKEFSYRSFDGISSLAREHYQEASLPLQLGDVIVILDAERNWVHACNYIAGGMTFTKNGESETRPWILSHFAHVTDRYKDTDNDGLIFLRRRPQSR